MQGIDRTRPTEVGSERDTLTQLLDDLRSTIVWKASGLTDEQAFGRLVPASDLTVGELVKHLTGVERFWFSIDFANEDIAWPWTDDDPHGNFVLGPDDTIDGLIADYLSECQRSRDVVAGSTLDGRAGAEGMDFSLRYALAHMIEESARRCGHLDLIREQIDGLRGE